MKTINLLTLLSRLRLRIKDHAPVIQRFSEWEELEAEMKEMEELSKLEASVAEGIKLDIPPLRSVDQTYEALEKKCVEYEVALKNIASLNDEEAMREEAERVLYADSEEQSPPANPEA